MAALTSGCLAGCKSDPKDSTPVTSGDVAGTETLRVVLDHNIYLKGENPVVASAENYSAALKQWMPISNLTMMQFEFDHEATGEVEVLVKNGKDSCKVKILVFESAKAAAEANSIYSDEAVEALKIDRIYKKDTHTVTFTSYEEEIDGKFTGIKVKQRAAVNPNGFNQIKGTDVWYEDAETGVHSILDPERYSVPHTFLENKVDENGNLVQKVDEEGNPVTNANGNPVYEQVQMQDQGNYYGAYEEARWKVEMIFDQYGRVCYMTHCFPANSWTGRVGHPDTNKWYSNSAFADYYNDNPAFIFQEDYREDDGTVINPSHYEKVIPHGGFYFVAGATEASVLYKAMSGVDEMISDDTTPHILNQNLMRENARMEASRCLLDLENKTINVYVPASNLQTYVYYLAQVETGAATDAAKWAEAVTTGQEVLKGIVEVNNELIASEPVLADYYSNYLGNLFNTWRSQILANK